MENCPFNWTDILKTNCSISLTYIRPDEGITVMPWLYSSIFFTLHLPLVLVRVLKWNVGQWWSLVMAAFSLSIVSLTYASTQWDPEQIYAWQPVTLIGDVGAVVQVLVLVIEQSAEDDQHRNEDRRRILRSCRKYIPGIPRQPISQENNEDHALPDGDDHIANNDQKPALANQNVNAPTWRPFRWDEWVVIVVSGLLLLGLLTLQILALRHTTLSLQGNPLLQDSYCSPAFQIGTQVYDLACNEFPITPNFRGTGCIKVPGDQLTWLSGVRAVLIVQLILEILDVAILILVKGTTRFQGARMKRPWFSIFMGIGFLCALIAVGVYQAGNSPLPSERGSTMPVVVNGTFEKMCSSHLTPGGLRGTIIAWSDAAFKGLGSGYSENGTVGATTGL